MGLTQSPSIFKELLLILQTFLFKFMYYREVIVNIEWFGLHENSKYF